MTFDRNQLTGVSTKPDISFLDDIIAGAEDTAIAKTVYMSMPTAM